MDKLITTPYDFIWKIKNSQDYWANSRDEIKFTVFVNGKERGGFAGINRTFDDDHYYVNFYTEDGYDYCSAYTDTEIILVANEK